MAGLILVPVLFVLFFGVGNGSLDQDLGEHHERYEQAKRSELTVIHFFDDRWCPVCQEAKSFVQNLAEADPDLGLEIYPISETELIHKMAADYGVDDYNPFMAPLVFINDEVIQFSSFGERQEARIKGVLSGETVDDEEEGYVFTLPIIDRELVVREWSLPVITVVLGSLDGFNICSLGALVLILSLVLVLDSRKLIFFYGGLFIFTAVLVYGILVFVWGQLFQALIGYLDVLAYIVGLAALAGAVYFLKEFWRFYRYGPTCGFSDSKLARQATDRVMKVFKDPTSKPLALAGAVVVFAAAITLVELPCSIGVPIAFTGILVERGVSLGAYTGYIVLYLFFYMLIEMIVFSGAVWSKKLWFAGSKAITWVTLIGGLVLLYLAWYYLSDLVLTWFGIVIDFYFGG